MSSKKAVRQISKKTASTKYSAKNYYFGANENNRHRAKAFNKNKTHTRNNYLDLGFFQTYSPEEMRENLFFVFQSGTTHREQIREQGLPGTISHYQKLAEQTLMNAARVSLSIEQAFMKDFFDGCKQYQGQEEAFLAIMEMYGLGDIFRKNGSYSTDDVQTFFNSKLFGFAQTIGSTGNITYGKSGIVISDVYEICYEQIRHSTYEIGITFSKNKNTPEIAKQKISNLLVQYAEGLSPSKDSASGFGGLFGDFFQNASSDQIKSICDEMAENFVEQMKTKDADTQVNMVEAAVISDQKPDAVSFRGGGKENLYSGTLWEIIPGEVMNQIAGKSFRLADGKTTATFVETGTRAAKKVTSRFSQQIGKTRKKSEYGRTDIQGIFTGLGPKNNSYTLNISMKSVMGYSKAADGGKGKSKATKTARLYGGGQLVTALDRIESSSLFDQGGLMTTQDFDDIVWLIINGAQGGLFEDNREQILQIFQALISFCAMDEMTVGVDLTNSLLQGKIDNPNPFSNGGIINMICVNGYMIPASRYFENVYALFTQIRTNSLQGTISFANTFPEADMKTQRFMLGYLDWLDDNGLRYIHEVDKDGNPIHKGRKGGGDPDKVKGNILQNTKANGFTLKYSGSISDFWNKMIN